MTTLKNKIIKNFIAGILSCILVFSILITLLVTLNYNDLFKAIDDKRPKEVVEQFTRLNNDSNISGTSMWAYLSNMAIDQKVDIKYYDEKGNLLKHLKGRDESDHSKILTKEYRFIDENNNSKAGKIEIYYNRDYTGVNEMKGNFTQAVLYAITISLAIGLVIAIILSTNISKPITSIGESTLAIKEGNYNLIVEDTDIREIEILKDNINYLSSNLKRQESIRKQYAQDISHELRTPLTNLKLYIEAMKDGVAEADPATLDILSNEIVRLEGLVVGLKNTFDENVSYAILSKSEVNITELIEYIAGSFLAKAKLNNINIETHLDTNVIFTTDRDKLSQIIQNLVSNAIKAIGKDGKIDIRLRETEKEILINVIDTGIGIKEDDIPRIFERFYRVEDSRNTKENGVGLGLAITKNFAEALSGKIKVKSKLGEGSDFAIIFEKNNRITNDKKKEKLLQ
ncbi:ATPase/histidine kinase/DNA gyrase B/HSP90 domain protein [Anaerococcus lactolyticus ATCC 51172]|uniref:histidine kinase n=1 Tax=Anaerococcus lactolyticus ATCC 51172 TaxID=525254 RepID=C2BIB5_9FIRM|nr:ATP-binding protein [Anaerococcus lactolyticus]EEI85409.1 ATPase/histidine kinase/DNA gyrase B/HSP90 domain protein [Anaerococcus lactolyticus ATCC 51172]